MAITSKFLRDIEAEARPIIERQMNDAKIIAGLRDVVAAAGGDWGALKALIKARVEDDNDETGEGKRVRKVREKADCIVAYDDMLGSNMNEKNFSASQSYAEAKGRGVDHSSTHPHDPLTGELTDTQEQPEEPATQSTEQPTAAARVSTPAANTRGQTGTADRPARSPVPASAKAEAKTVGQSGQEAAVELPVDTHSPSPETPQAIADEEAAPPAKSSAPIQSAADSLPGAVKAPEAGTPPPASAAALSEKKDCLKLRNGHCKISFETSALCSECNRAKAEKARAA